jgi:hypothetical protein
MVAVKGMLSTKALKMALRAEATRQVEPGQGGCNKRSTRCNKRSTWSRQEAVALREKDQ